MIGFMNRRHAHSILIATRALAVALVVTVSVPAQADQDPERELLARLGYELAALTTLIDDAEAAANPDARVRFRYDWLREDIRRVRTGIQEHVDAPRAEPRTVAPLRGDYRR